MEDHEGTVTEKEIGTRLRAETPLWVNLHAQQSFGGQELQRSEALRRAGTETRRTGEPLTVSRDHPLSASFLKGVGI